jgi:RNA polymerase sigma factor (sigma-70 family)
MFGAWLRQITVNLWLQHARRKRITMEPIDEENIANSHVMPPDVRHMDLKTAIDRLRPPERLCVTLAYAEGMTHAEIAQTTGLPLGTVKSHIIRAAAKLRAWIPSNSAKLSR